MISLTWSDLAPGDVIDRRGELWEVTARTESPWLLTLRSLMTDRPQTGSPRPDALVNVLDPTDTDDAHLVELAALSAADAHRVAVATATVLLGATTLGVRDVDDPAAPMSCPAHGDMSDRALAAHLWIFHRPPPGRAPVSLLAPPQRGDMVADHESAHRRAGAGALIRQPHDHLLTEAG